MMNSFQNISSILGLRGDYFVKISNLEGPQHQKSNVIADFFKFVSTDDNVTRGSLDENDVQDDAASETSFDALPLDKDFVEDVRPYEFPTLKSYEPKSWSVQVMDLGYRPGDTLWFRLVRNSDMHVGLYLEGREVLVSVNAILEDDANTTFYVHFLHNSFITDKRDVHTLLKRALYRSKLPHSGEQLIREVFAKDVKEKRSTQALTTLALYPRPSFAEYNNLAVPDLLLQLHHGQMMELSKAESASEEAMHGSALDTSRTRSLRSRS